MKRKLTAKIEGTGLWVIVWLSLIGLAAIHPAAAQELPDQAPQVQSRSAGKAFIRSLILPGWGHRYAQGGSWRGAATFYLGADIGLWAGLISAEWRRNHFVQSYQTLATSHGNADIEGKDRTFYLNLATYQSSDEYLAFQLRNRAWDRVDYVSDPAFHWEWESTEDFQDFRDLREDAESLRRRRGIFIALLVANRILSGISSIQTANKANASLSLSAPLPRETIPMLNVRIVF